jgi:hypothetical protein
VLEQNYPNPFNSQTAIGIVMLKIYNVLGQKVATLLNNVTMEEGEHEVTFDASGLPSGVYFYRLSVNESIFSQTRKFVLMK